ncbi:hypothetical protein [Deinococcus xinjiangensis]
MDIYYESVQDYKKRTALERSQAAWNDIWFAPNRKHREVSVEVFEFLR